MIPTPTPGEILAVFSVFGAVVLTVVGAVLKLAGVLLLSWWWVASPLPAVVIGIIFCKGIISLFDL